MPKRKKQPKALKKLLIPFIVLLVFILLLFSIRFIISKTTIKTSTLTPEMEKLALQAPPPGKMVDVGGFKMHLNCLGSGSPTVIFESGNGDNSLVWANIAPVIAQKNRACTYDRAGLGWSEADFKPYSLENNVNNFHALLVNAGIKPPYLLTAHSIGGIYARVYYQKYPNEVVGMVLVDPSAEKWQTALDKKTSDEVDALTFQSIKSLEDLFLDIKSGKIAADISQVDLDTRYPKKDGETVRILIATNPLQAETQIKELKNANNIFNQASTINLTNLGNIPLILLSSDTNAYPDMLKPLIPTYIKLHQLQQEIAKQSTQGSFKMVPGTTHYIQLDKPEAVIQAITEVLNKVQ